MLRWLTGARGSGEGTWQGVAYAQRDRPARQFGAATLELSAGEPLHDEAMPPRNDRTPVALTAATSSESRLLGYVGLFSSVGTLLCCALPSLLVLLGFGATVASFLSVAPWMVELSRRKGWVFGIAAVLVAANAYYILRIVPRLLVSRGACPADDPDACARATRFSRLLLSASTLMLVVGASVAYLLPALLAWDDA